MVNKKPISVMGAGKHPALIKRVAVRNDKIKVNALNIIKAVDTQDREAIIAYSQALLLLISLNEKELGSNTK